MSIGLISISGVSAGLLLAIGGVAFGGFAIGSVAFGVVGIGFLPFSALDVSPETMGRLWLALWGLVTAIVTLGIAGLVIGFKANQPERTKVE